MEANVAHTEKIRKRRLEGCLDAELTSILVNIDNSDTQSENIIKYVIKRKREAEEERVNSKKSHKKAKKPIAKKGKNTKKKKTQPGSPEVEKSSERFKEQQPVKGPGPRVRNQKAVKELTREERVEIMDTQKVLSRRVFYPNIATKFGMVTLVDVCLFKNGAISLSLLFRISTS
ncbi:hypothetical protein H5410_053299 [Solanum commersonii]|uniref:Uncharacterized protein n=1 Tax=Solanum commersonii TaxID=4109 RepID=A0A9J5X6P3_SOLCO|nr:hypothetical protein H5410_053299 [Solanum commersonii]